MAARSGSDEPRIGARRGIALQIARVGAPHRRCVSRKRASARRRCEPRRPVSMSGQHDVARVSGRSVSSMAMSSRSCGQPSGGAFGPLDRAARRRPAHRRGRARRALRRLEPIEVAMTDGETRRLVALHQREGRARHLALARRDGRPARGRSVVLPAPSGPDSVTTSPALRMSAIRLARRSSRARSTSSSRQTSVIRRG